MPKAKDEAKPTGKASHFLLADRTHAMIAGETVTALPGDYYLMLERGEHKLSTGARIGEGHGQTTRNYAAMGRLGEYARTARGGPPPAWIPPKQAGAYVDWWHQEAIRFLREELEVGLMTGEQMAVAPHDELHLAPAALCRIVAREEGHRDVLELSDRWWRSYLTVVGACISPSGVLCHAGARSRGYPTSEVGGAIYAEVTGNVPVREPGAPSAALRAVRQLLASGDTFGNMRHAEKNFAETAVRRLDEVKLLYPMVVERYAGGVRSYVPAPAPPFYLRELFASFVEVTFGREKSANQLLKAGKLRVVKGWSSDPLTPRLSSVAVAGKTR